MVGSSVSSTVSEKVQVSENPPSPEINKSTVCIPAGSGVFKAGELDMVIT